MHTCTVRPEPWLRGCYAPWIARSTSPSPPPSSPRRLARRRQTGWSCTGGAGGCSRCRAPRSAATAPAWSVARGQTLARRDTRCSDTGGTESEKSIYLNVAKRQTSWQNSANPELLPSSGTCSYPRWLRSRKQNAHFQAPQDTSYRTKSTTCTSTYVSSLLIVTEEWSF